MVYLLVVSWLLDFLGLWGFTKPTRNLISQAAIQGFEGSLAAWASDFSVEHGGNSVNTCEYENWKRPVKKKNIPINSKKRKPSEQKEQCQKPIAKSPRYND